MFVLIFKQSDLFVSVFVFHKQGLRALQNDEDCGTTEDRTGRRRLTRRTKTSGQSAFERLDGAKLNVGKPTQEDIKQIESALKYGRDWTKSEWMKKKRL